MLFLKANTAVDVLIGPFVDDTDGKTAETGLTISQADIKLSKNGQALAQKNDSTAASADANGYYNCELDATDTNTEGNLVLVVNESGALPVRHEFNILSEAAFDSMFAAKDSGYMDVNIKAVSEDTTAADNCKSFFDGTGYAGTNNVIPTVTTLTGHTAQTGDSFARIGATGSGLTTLATQASVNTIDDIVDAIFDDTNSTIPTQLSSIAGAGFVTGTDSLEALRNRGDSAWITATGFAPANEYDTEMARITANVATASALATSDGKIDDILEDTVEIQASLSGFSIGSASISKIADSFTKAGAEPETNTYTATQVLDGTYHIVEDDVGSTEFYYEFDIGGNGVPTEFIFNGYAQGNNATYTVKAYDWANLAWAQVGTITGTAGTTEQEKTFIATTNYVGTGSDDGTVRVQFTSADGTAIGVNRILCSYATVYQSVGYSLGAIWVDTNNGTAGNAAWVNGVADNPVDSWADALTLSTALGLKKFILTSGSSITLTSATEGYNIIGYGATIALGGQSINGTLFEGARITGNDSGTNASAVGFQQCKMGGNTLGQCRLNQCPLVGDLVLAQAGTYILEGCLSAIAGTATPSIDFGAAVGNTGLNMRHYSGGVEIENIGSNGTDNMSLEGFGQLILNANCSGGTIAVRGNFTVTDNASGVVTLSDDARIDVGQINAAADTALSDYGPMLDSEDGSSFTSLPNVTLANGAHGGAAASITLASYSDFTGAAEANPNVLQDGTITVTSQTEFTLSGGSADDDAYNNQVIVFEDASTATQKSVRTITDYVGSTRTVTIDSAPDFTITTSDNFVILAVAPGSTPPTAGQIRAEMDSNSTQLAAIVEDTGTTLDTLIRDIPTNAELTAAFTEIKGATWSDTSDTLEDIRDNAGGSAPTVGEIRTELEGAGTHLTLILADTDELQSDDIPAAIAALDAVVDTVKDDTTAIKVITDALTSAAAAKLALSAGTIVQGTVSHDNTAATTTVFYSDDVTEATADHYNGRLIGFLDGALQYQYTAIEDYELVSGEGKFTVTAVTEAPADNSTFIIV